MLRLRTVIKYKTLVTFKLGQNYSTLALARRRNGIFKSCIYGSILTSTGCVTWCACQDTTSHDDDSTINDSQLIRFRKWIHTGYEERVLHSSLFRFGRAAYAVSIVILKINKKCSSVKTRVSFQ